MFFVLILEDDIDAGIIKGLIYLNEDPDDLVQKYMVRKK